MKLHTWAQLIKMYVTGKNENSCSFSFFSYLPMINEINGQVTQNLKRLCIDLTICENPHGCSKYSILLI